MHKRGEEDNTGRVERVEIIERKGLQNGSETCFHVRFGESVNVKEVMQRVSVTNENASFKVR